MSTLEHEKIPTTAPLEEVPSTVVATEQEHEKDTIQQDETPVSSVTKDDAREESTSRTLALIKPDAMQANHKDEIIVKIKENGFRIAKEQKLQLSKEKASLFYKEHEGKSFYQDLTSWMSSAPIYALILEKQDAVQAWRHLMGPTNSNKARDVEPNSVRALFGTDGSHNATHGSDSQASAEREIALIFENDEPHVVEVQALVDEFATQIVCKPDAVDESKEQLPEVTKEPAAAVSTVKKDDLDTKNVTVDHEANEVEPTVDTKHLHTADLATSQDNVTDLSQKEGGETIHVAPEDIKKDETEETRVAADTEEKEAADTEKKEAVVADPVDASLDVKLNVSLENTDVTDNLPASTGDNKNDGALKEKQVVQVANADDDVLDTKEAPSTKVPNAEETPATNAEQVPQVDAVVAVTVEATATDANDITPDTTKGTEEADTTVVADNTKEDTHAEEKKDTKQIKEKPVLEKQDIKMAHENVAIEAEIVTANVDVVENHAETKEDTEAQQELEAIVNVNEVEINAVLEPAATVPVAMETSKAEPSAVREEAEEEKELSNTEQDKKQEEPVTVAIHADIVLADVQGNDDDTDHQQQHGVTSDVAIPQENETQQVNAIIISNNDVNAERLLDTPKEKSMTEGHQDVKLNESVTQEKESDPISTTPTTTTTATATTTDTDANTPSNGSSSDSSKNSSVTTDKSQVKESIKEAHVNKKQPKLRAPSAPGAAGASSVGHHRSAAAATTAATDKKKVTSTGLRKPTSTLKKKTTTTTTSSNGADAEDNKDKPKPKTRVPRVALLSQQPKKKPAVQDDAPTNTEVKTKKAAVSTRSLVSRLTAPTAASARKKTSSSAAAAEGTTTTKPADPVRQKKLSSTATKKVPITTTTTGSRASKASTTSKPAAATTTASGIKKPSTAITATKTTGGVRRTSPPTSTTASKKADGTTVKRTTGTTGTTGTRATASGLPSSANPGKTSTRKETLSTGSKLKKTAPITKKPSGTALTTPKKIKKSDTDAAVTVESPTVSAASKASSESSHAADHHDTADMEASAPTSSVSSISNHPDETTEATTSETVASNTNEAEANPVLDSTNDESDSNNNGGVDQELINESEIGSDVIESSQDVTEDEKKATEKQDDIIVDLPKQEINNEQEVESVDISTKEQEQEQDKVLIVEPSANQASDAEVAAITATNTNTNNNHITPAVAITSNKPQMASLRSRFENLNNNNTNNTLNHSQLQTTSSKEIRSKSPNRISDMINRFQ